MTDARGRSGVEDAGLRSKLRDLVLGKLDEETKDELEKELLVGDGEAFEEALAEEAELLDAYARRELSTPDRKRVEELLQRSPRMRKRLVTARVLAQSGGSADWMVSPMVRWGSLAAGLAVACLAGWLLVQNLELRTRALGMEAELAELSHRSQELKQGMEDATTARDSLAQELASRNREIKELEGQLATVQGREDIPVTVSFVLTSGILRGLEAPTRHVIPESATDVRLQLDLEEDAGYPGYRVAVRKSDGGEIWSEDGLKAENLSWGTVVTVTLPSSVLVPGRYEVALFGGSSEGLDELAYFDLKVGRE